MTPAQLEQRRTNVNAIAARRRAQTKCKRNHDLKMRGDGRRYCPTCNLDHDWYRRHGMKVPA